MLQIFNELKFSWDDGITVSQFFSVLFIYTYSMFRRTWYTKNTKHSQNIQPNDWMYGIRSTYIRPNTINHWLWYSKWMLKPKMASNQHKINTIQYSIYANENGLIKNLMVPIKMRCALFCSFFLPFYGCFSIGLAYQVNCVLCVCGLVFWFAFFLILSLWQAIVTKFAISYGEYSEYVWVPTTTIRKWKRCRNIRGD